MIIEQVFSFFSNTFIKLISNINIGSLPSELMSKFYNIIDFMFENMSLLGLFVRPQSLVTVSVLMLAIVNFEKIYRIANLIKNKFLPL